MNIARLDISRRYGTEAHINNSPAQMRAESPATVARIPTIPEKFRKRKAAK
jgi:hypothetical protein